MAREGYLYYTGMYENRRFWVVQGGFSINGYVEIDPSNDPEEKDVEVHGGVTFKGYLTQVEDDRVIVTMDKVHDNSKLVYGFDTAHYNDEPYYSDESKENLEKLPTFREAFQNMLGKNKWNPDLVKSECEQMIDSIVEQNSWR